MRRVALVGAIAGWIGLTAPLAGPGTADAASPACTGGTVNVVAHQDDDLLFLSPDLLRDVRSGKCLTTVFVTAGDAGGETRYWADREVGAMAAYAQMAGVTSSWIPRTLTVGARNIASAQLSSRSNVNLVFLRLPDGQIDGSGFPSQGGQSLERLYSGSLEQVRTVDGSDSYTRVGLISTLAGLVGAVSPSVVHTMDFREEVPPGGVHEHSDHVTTARLTRDAVATSPRPLAAYAGYRSVDVGPENIFGAELTAKTDAFVAYLRHDKNVKCKSAKLCLNSSNYGSWLKRQYVVQ